MEVESPSSRSCSKCSWFREEEGFVITEMTSERKTNYRDSQCFIEIVHKMGGWSMADERWTRVWLWLKEGLGAGEGKLTVVYLEGFVFQRRCCSFTALAMRVRFSWVIKLQDKVWQILVRNSNCWKELRQNFREILAVPWDVERHDVVWEIYAFTNNGDA
jgi:hypothetical protein